jgi:hypothetical protein
MRGCERRARVFGKVDADDFSIVSGKGRQVVAGAASRNEDPAGRYDSARAERCPRPMV